MKNKMKRRIERVLIICLVFVLLANSVSAISRTEFRNFLKQEIKNYYNNEPTFLTTDELGKTVYFYFTSSGEEIDLSQSDLLQTSIEIIVKNVEEVMEPVEEFSCIIKATGIEIYEIESRGIEKEGYRVKCCDNFLNILRTRICKPGHVRYTECFEMNKQIPDIMAVVVIREGMSLSEGTEICKEKIGKQWEALGEFLGFGGFGGANIDKCKYQPIITTTQTKPRIERETIRFTLAVGERKNLETTVKIFPKYGGQISNIEYSIKCDSKVSGKISNKIISVER